MARHEQDREDLMREATALVERVELRFARAAESGAGDPLVAGFRRGGELSLYFGDDESYHFIAQGELRRAFHDGRLIKAEQGELIALKRERSAAEVTLLRHPLVGQEASALLLRLEERLAAVEKALSRGEMQIGREIVAGQELPPARSPELGPVARRLAEWLTKRELPTRVARAPNVR